MYTGHLCVCVCVSRLAILYCEHNNNNNNVKSKESEEENIRKNQHTASHSVSFRAFALFYLFIVRF